MRRTYGWVSGVAFQIRGGAGESMRRSDFPFGRRFIAAVGSAGCIIGFSADFVPQAQALPSFARQTGQPCGACHTDFPALTPYGRRFKLLGYTTGGGQFRTTPFPVFPGPSDSRSQDEKMRAYAKALDGGANDNKDYVPPISMMAFGGFTHTQAPQPNPPPYAANNNFEFDQFSGFWGGAITDHIGAFAQVTYDGVGRAWSWDNADIRYANTASIGPAEVIYGITANNNPTVQDVWNTTPAWSFPYVSSGLAATPATGTLIEGTFAQHVVGVGAYTFINDMLYLELTGYKTPSTKVQNDLGAGPFNGGSPGQFDGVAPYWRVAFEPKWGPHSLMVGTFGMHAAVQPFVDPTGVTTSATLPQSDKFTDVGVDAQYQFQGPNYWFTLRGSYIHENQKLDATFGALQQPGAANPTNFLNSLHLQASLAWGADNRFVLTGQYFDISGSSDAVLYQGLVSGLSPNSNGFIGELAYIPYGVSQAPGWPWANARIGLQYTYYNKFDGTTVGAHDNNTLFLHAWFAM
jgi:hypothetical protein